ncbi:hypothetical protein N7462_010316, partial [Penicillium macrosclerotiorum]|uniref:uncharacterized protein n=1 Tax=Penicillium macrosclerotiorum TaxID=303699 RepID=UPI002547E09D
GSSNIAIFSDKKILSISNRLGHKRFHALFHRLDDSMSARARRDIRSTNPATSSGYFSTTMQIGVTIESIRTYCDCAFDLYFGHSLILTHCSQSISNLCIRYILSSIEMSSRKALSTIGAQNFVRKIQRSQPYIILDGGSFQPGHGTAWRLFQVALGRFTELVTSKETLLHAQAIFCRNVSCVQIEKLLTTEVARIAQALGINRAVYEDMNTDQCRRTFWVIYILEKTQCFACSRDSWQILNDSNISTPIPQIPETAFHGWDYFRALCRFSRLLSKAQIAVFSISATLLPSHIMVATIEELELELENWKDSIDEKYRPGHIFLQPDGLDSLSIGLKIKIAFHYYSASIALIRLKMNILSPDLKDSRLKSEMKLISACRSITELTRFIDSNLALIGMACGYFCRLELSSKDLFQTSALSDLEQIARDYIKQFETGGPTEAAESSMPPSCSTTQETGDGNAPHSNLSYPVSFKQEPPNFEIQNILIIPRFKLDASFELMQHLPQTHGDVDENMATAMHDDLSAPTFEPIFSEGVDLTNFFAGEMRDFFDASMMDLSLTQ